jgi:hypothetical protein
MYTEGVFAEEDGDRGANRILTKQRGNLHALWDQLLGDKLSLGGTNKRVAEIRADSELVAQGRELGKIADQQVWLEESRSFAETHVYRPEVLSQFDLVRRGLVDKPQAVDLAEEYLKDAGKLAQRRAYLAACRLANEWRGIE